MTSEIGPLTLDAGVREMSGGMTLLGGSPFRVLRLRPEESDLLRRVGAAKIAVTANERAVLDGLIAAGLVHPVALAGASSLADVDVVIPCRDEEILLRRLLAVLPILDFASVTVVDDGSEVPVRNLGSGVSITRRDSDHGPGPARQQGWKLGSAKHVLFIDADIVTDGDWIHPLLAWVDSADVAAAAPRVQNEPTGSAISNYEQFRSPLDLGPASGMVIPRSRIPFVPTAALLVRREALVAVEGFDLNLVGGEDVDLVWRLLGAGWRVRYEPAVSVRHHPRGSWREFSRQRFGYGQSNAALATRHPDCVTPLEISPYSAASWFLTLFGRRGIASGAALAVCSTVALTPHLQDMVEDPPRVAVQLAGTGHLKAGEAIASAVTRAWFPAWFAASFMSRRIRWATTAATLLPPIFDWLRKRPAVKLAPWVAQRAVDDVSFAAGVWLGAIRHRSLAAMMPRSARLDQLLVSIDDLVEDKARASAASMRDS